MKKITLGLLLSCSFSLPTLASDEIDKQCVPQGQWVASNGKHWSNSSLIKKLSQSQVVLIGEDHENPEHHRMQLHTIAQVYAEQPDLALGFEAFPRSVQKVLDKWVAGEIDEKTLINDTRWDEVWRFNKDYYLPMFHFARMNKIPMLALNVDRKLVSDVGNKGWDKVAESEKEGISKPAAPSQDYIKVLAEVFSQHMPKHAHGNADEQNELSEQDINEIANNPSFQRFMQGQLVWDRAMAEAIAKSIKQDKKSLVVGIMGAGHVMGDYGVVHQLNDLKVDNTITLMPWDGTVECEQLKDGAFDYAFGVKYFSDEELKEADHPRLGVYLEHVDGVEVTRIVDNSVAAEMGIKVGDKITKIAGKPVEKVMDVVSAVKQTAFGTWLPLEISRDGKSLELVAKFPPKL